MAIVELLGSEYQPEKAEDKGKKTETEKKPKAKPAQGGQARRRPQGPHGQEQGRGAATRPAPRRRAPPSRAARRRRRPRKPSRLRVRRPRRRADREVGPFHWPGWPSPASRTAATARVGPEAQAARRTPRRRGAGVERARPPASHGGGKLRAKSPAAASPRESGTSRVRVAWRRKKSAPSGASSGDAKPPSPCQGVP